MVEALPTQLSAIEVESGFARPLAMKPMCAISCCNPNPSPQLGFHPSEAECSAPLGTSQISRCKPALTTKASGHSLTQPALTGSPLQQYVSEGLVVNQRRQRHMTNTTKSLQGWPGHLWPQGASSRTYELLRSCSYAHTPCTRPSGPKTTTLMPRLAVKVSAAFLEAGAAKKAIHHNEQNRNAMWQMHT